MVDGFDSSTLNIENHKNKFVHSIDGDLVGVLDSINNDGLIVKKEVIGSIFYRIPFDKLKRCDEHGVWLNLSHRQVLENHSDLKNENGSSTETVTFRINRSLINNIKIESENRMISTNDFLNQIFKRFVEWNRYEPIVGLVHIPKPVVTELFNKKSDKEIVQMAQTIGKDTISNTILLMKGTNDLKTFLIWIEAEMNTHSLHIRHTFEKGHHKYIIKHDLGYKFSLYYKTIINSIFRELVKEKITFTITSELILFEFISLESL
jgi:hypothetical protein